jgi:hypothetical protein
MSIEEWRGVPGYPSYRVSSLGRVVSLRPWRGLPVPRELAAGISGPGYRMVYLTAGGRGRHLYVHQLVAAAFHGPRPEGMEVRHLDGNRLNNAASNLSYGTTSQNAYDRVRHGTHGNTAKVKCAQGHPFDALNTIVPTEGQRRCRACANQWNREYRLRQKERVA